MASSERYRIEIKPSAAKAIERLASKRDRQRIIDRVSELAHDPRPLGCAKLAGRESVFRVRQGQFRVIYQIEVDRLVIMVMAVGHRCDVYRGR